MDLAPSTVFQSTRVDSLQAVPALPHCLPAHQLTTIHDYFDCLQFAQMNDHECSTCHERFHGIRMQGLQCDRCSREVNVVIIFDSALTFLQSGIHCFSAQNFTDPGVIPEDLRETLHGLMQMEEMLCSLASLCFMMWVSKDRQYKSRGNVITFPQDLAPLCTTLPCLPEELDVLLVWKPDARDSIAYKDFHVRKHKVLSFLHYLCAHNDFYQDIVIRATDDVNLPDDASVLSHLPSAPPQHADDPLCTDATRVHPGYPPGFFFEPLSVPGKTLIHADR